jgi:protein-tyrosine phosphatase
MTDQPNILVVCGKNKKRSKTAEQIFKKDPRIYIRSVGLSPKSERKISENDLNWADLVFVMEQDHLLKIKDLFDYLDLPEIEVLDIEDEYEYMDEDLVEILTDRINDTLEYLLGI